MSEIKHTSLKAELLYLIGRATAPLSCAELYEKCELADEVAKVAKALANLQSDGKIKRVEGEGRARYTLAAGVAAPAPAGKTGRSKAVQADDAAHSAPLTGIRPDVQPDELPALDIPILSDPGISLQGAAGKTQRAKPAKPKGDRSADAGKAITDDQAAESMLRGIDIDASAARMADAMLRWPRPLLRQAQPRNELGCVRWWIDQDGGLEIAAPDGDDTVVLGREQAQRMAAMVMAVHDELEVGQS